MPNMRRLNLSKYVIVILIIIGDNNLGEAQKVLKTITTNMGIELAGQ